MIENNEKLLLEGGFGPIQATSPQKIDILPLTIVLGVQGTGKSLLSQLLYFLRDAEHLVDSYFNQDLLSGLSSKNAPDRVVRFIMDGVRSGNLTGRSLASFLTTNKVIAKHQFRNGTERQVTLYRVNRKIHPNKDFREEVRRWLEHLTNPQSASLSRSNSIFMPAERTFFSRFINASPATLNESALPITMQEFTKTLTQVRATHERWQANPESRPDEVKLIDRLVSKPLGGQATIAQRGPYSKQWQWRPEGSEQPIEIELASSGQMATWPLISTAQALFGWNVTQRPRYIHIEEPETHLHPAGQVAIVNLIVYLVNQGFHLFVTTHSLEILYALNALLLAHKQFGERDVPKAPPRYLRLSSADVAVYHLADGSIVRSDDREGNIDDTVLGEVLGALEIEYNRFAAYGALWE